MSQHPESGRTSDVGNYRGEVARQFEELSRRNPRALAMDGLLLITTGFFAVLLTKAWATWTIAGLSIPYSWPAAIAALPLGGLLYFGWRSSWAFFGTQIATVVLTVVAARAGLLPL